MREPESTPRPSSRREWRRLSAAADSPTILTVCTGNICRSPMAEVLLRSRLPGDAFRIHSAGTRALIGREMTPLAQEFAVAADARPAEAATHRARLLTEELLADADLILAMTREHRSHAVQLAPQRLRQAFTVREFARLSHALSTESLRATAAAAGPSPSDRLAAVVQQVTAQRGQSQFVPEEDDVIDPYRRDRSVYELSAEQLTPAIDEVARVLAVIPA